MWRCMCVAGYAKDPSKQTLAFCVALSSCTECDKKPGCSYLASFWWSEITAICALLKSQKPKSKIQWSLRNGTGERKSSGLETLLITRRDRKFRWDSISSSPDSHSKLLNVEKMCNEDSWTNEGRWCHQRQIEYRPAKAPSCLLKSQQTNRPLAIFHLKCRLQRSRKPGSAKTNRKIDP